MRKVKHNPLDSQENDSKCDHIVVYLQDEECHESEDVIGILQECDNCGEKWEECDLRQIRHYFQRVEPGSIVPSGECPECGCLCYPIISGHQRALSLQSWEMPNTEFKGKNE